MASRVVPKRPAKLFIDEWLEVRDLSIDDLAVKLGVAYQTVWRWIEKERGLDYGTMKAIADALDLEVADLMRRPQDAPIGPLLSGLSDAAKREIMAFIEFQRKKSE